MLSVSALFSHGATHRAFEALLAIFEQGKCNWAVVTRGNKDDRRGGSEQANDR
jgi:hypothetical protein